MRPWFKPYTDGKNKNHTYNTHTYTLYTLPWFGWHLYLPTTPSRHTAFYAEKASQPAAFPVTQTRSKHQAWQRWSSMGKSLIVTVWKAAMECCSPYLQCQSHISQLSDMAGKSHIYYYTCTLHTMRPYFNQPHSIKIVCIIREILRYYMQFTCLRK